MAGMPSLKLCAQSDICLRLHVVDRLHVGLECPQVSSHTHLEPGPGWLEQLGLATCHCPLSPASCLASLGFITTRWAQDPWTCYMAAGFLQISHFKTREVKAASFFKSRAGNGDCVTSIIYWSSSHRTHPEAGAETSPLSKRKV